MSTLEKELSQNKMDPYWLVLLVFTAVFLASLFGIWTRPVGFLASFWPANALMLGILLRVPEASKWSGWLAGFVAFVSADLLTGSSVLRAFLLNSANLVSVAAAYFIVLSRLSADTIKLRQPVSIMYIVLAATVGGIAAGIVGIFANWILFNGKPLPAFTLWWASEIVNYVSILPILLSAPSWKVVLKWLRQRNITVKAETILPAASVLLSCVVAYVIGGPGAIAFPVLALLWCGLVYSVFPTAILTLCCSVFALLFIDNNYFGNYSEAIDKLALVSVRLGAAVVAVTPILISIIIGNRNRLLAELRYLSSHDSLTGIKNRAGFYSDAQKILADKNQSHGLIMIDIDHFKSINDNYGHAAGDMVLKEIAQIISRCLRSVDTVGRMGGEEFAVCLKGCDLSLAKKIAERIRVKISEESIVVKNALPISVTVSLGLSFITEENSKDLELLLNEADTALYKSKKKGRDRVEGAIT